MTMEEILTYERNLFMWINGSHTPFLDAVLWPFSGVLVWCPPFLVLLWFYLKRRKEWIPASLATGLVFVLCCVVSAFLFKPWFARLRPTTHPLFVEYVVLLHDYRANGVYGFISGHATSAFGFAVWSLLLVKNRIYTSVILLWAFLMGYSRIYLGAHFVSDVLAGLLVGSSLGGGVHVLYRQAVKRFGYRLQP
ncbi:MAG: phosphatase PAP2 family protein [Tannerella sp.]|jgi:undecaprenyl-diphosphatase|nr:phosphatase PAP2 family protein [Tannerella sp.]